MGNLEFISKAKKVHGDKYDYTQVLYTNSKTKVIIECKIHGGFTQRPCNHPLGRGCPHCARLTTISTLRSTRDEFISKALETHGTTYDYTTVDYINSSTKIIIACPKHGQFKQSPEHHLSGSGCPACAKKQRVKPLGTNNFISLAHNIHGDKFKYDNTTYQSAHQKVTIYCNKHGNFTQTARRHLQGHVGCPRCHTSKPQNLIISLLEQQNIPIIINDRSVISPYEIDIYIPQHKLGIEIHGIYYHSYDMQETKEQRHRHQHKALKASEQRITLLQLYEHELEHIDLIKSMINAKIGMADRIMARKCIVSFIKPSIADSFFTTNHLHGHRPAKYYIGLSYDNRLVACLSISKHHKYTFEIIRLAFSKNTLVIGGLEKMLQFIIKSLSPVSIVTWANMRLSTGSCYKRAGFKPIKTSKPNYMYTKSGKVYSRQYFQKHKLQTRLSCFDATLSESENMFANGYRRLWDAGHLLMVFTNYQEQS